MPQCGREQEAKGSCRQIDVGRVLRVLAKMEAVEVAAGMTCDSDLELAIVKVGFRLASILKWQSQVVGAMCFVGYCLVQVVLDVVQLKL